MAARQNAERRESEKRALQPGPVSTLAAGAPKLDRLIHERLRLGMVSALSVNESLTFN